MGSGMEGWQLWWLPLALTEHVIRVLFRGRGVFGGWGGGIWGGPSHNLAPLEIFSWQMCACQLYVACDIHVHVVAPQDFGILCSVPLTKVYKWRPTGDNVHVCHGLMYRVCLRTSASEAANSSRVYCRCQTLISICSLLSHVLAFGYSVNTKQPVLFPPTPPPSLLPFTIPPNRHNHRTHHPTHNTNQQE